MRNGTDVRYVNVSSGVKHFGEDNDPPKFAKLLAPQQAWVLDDVNSPFGPGMTSFKLAVLNAHNYGGRVMVTSNTSYDDLMKDGFVADPQDKARFMDRAKGIFAVLHITGVSQRSRTLWSYDLDK